MANICDNKLTVVGLTEKPKEFLDSLERAVYGQVLPLGDQFFSVVADWQRHPTFRFETKWEPPANGLITLSKEHKGARFLLKYSCWESGFRGQMVIRDGGVIEEVRRLGYNGPSYLFADLTHPLVDLFEPYTTPRTLAEQATGRLQDAIVIVKEVKETLEDKRFTSSSYRTRGDWNQVDRAHSGLAAMLDVMIRHAAEISFDGVMVSE